MQLRNMGWTRLQSRLRWQQRRPLRWAIATAGVDGGKATAHASSLGIRAAGAKGRVRQFRTVGYGRLSSWVIKGRVFFDSAYGFLDCCSLRSLAFFLILFLNVSSQPHILFDLKVVKANQMLGKDDAFESNPAAARSRRHGVLVADWLVGNGIRLDSST
jgi:hypothetical protein